MRKEEIDDREKPGRVNINWKATKCMRDDVISTQISFLIEFDIDGNPKLRSGKEYVHLNLQHGNEYTKPSTEFYGLDFSFTPEEAISLARFLLLISEDNS